MSRTVAALSPSRRQQNSGNWRQVSRRASAPRTRRRSHSPAARTQPMAEPGGGGSDRNLRPPGGGDKEALKRATSGSASREAKSRERPGSRDTAPSRQG